MGWGIVKNLWICFWASNMYSVLAYGVIGDYPRMGANIVEALGYAYLITKVEQVTN